MFTIPNALTLARACGIPLFLWLYLSHDSYGWAFFVLALGALTDYLDGKIARALHQESALGAAMDPAIDRLYILATLFALALKDVIPWWLVVVLLLRDAWLLLMLYIYRRKTGKVFVVSYLGKAATFNLLYAFPLLLVHQWAGIGEVAHIVGWSFALWGTGLYLWTGVEYSSTAFRATT